MFFLKDTVPFLSKEETEKILQSVRENELKTSGEIRICIESKCPFMNPLERAKEIFIGLKMHNTINRNAVLIYIAHKDKDFALYADHAIFNQVNKQFWHDESKQLANHFFHKDYVNGIIGCVNQIGKEMSTYFPIKGEQKNELPDEIIFGK